MWNTVFSHYTGLSSIDLIELRAYNAIQNIMPNYAIFRHSKGGAS